MRLVVSQVQRDAREGGECCCSWRTRPASGSLPRDETDLALRATGRPPSRTPLSQTLGFATDSGLPQTLLREPESGPSTPSQRTVRLRCSM
eukprot:scaffold69765_cov32-Phaeocystis_antarctica.AAC.2